MLRNIWCIFCFLLYVVGCSSLSLTQVNDWADDISVKIWKMWKDVSGFQHLKKAYEKSLKKVSRIDTEQLLTETAQKMEHYFSKKIDSLQRIKTKAESAYAERKNITVTANEVSYVNMIAVNLSNSASSSIPVTLHFDSRFKRNVTTQYSGIQIPTNVYHQGPAVLQTINWTSQLDEVFIDNLMNRDTTLKWQYFGSRDAVFRTYPAKRWKDNFYSARRRPWYTQGATSPKNMVILIDSSGSMVGKNSRIARLAVSNLIDTLSQNDFFNVIYFNKAVRSLSCDKSLIQATKRNREWYKSRLMTSDCKDYAAWENALKEAFESLKKTDGANCQSMIMIFSDGTEHKYENIFEHYNKDKKIRVFSYLLGTPTPASSSENLMWMACSNKGYFYKVPTVGSVRDLIEDYVSVLSRPMAATNETLNPVWTSIYRDASGLGIMVTATLPVFHERLFLGVCGTDVTIKELSNFTYEPYIGAGGYAFIIDNNGDIVKHPNLRAMFGYVESTGDVDLTMAELVPEEQKNNLLVLREKILSTKDGETGEKTITGFSFTEYERYLRIIPLERKYIFTKMKQTPFSLGITSFKYGYEVLEYQPYFIDNKHNGSDEVVFLEDWQHCNSTTLPLTATSQDLRRLLTHNCTGNILLLLDLNITQNVWPQNITRFGISTAFLKTNWGLLKVSQFSDRSEIMKEKMLQRVSNLKTNAIIVSAPYNDGKSEYGSSSLFVYKGIHINVSNISITPVVSGFQIDEEFFLKDNLSHIDTKDNYRIYLLDENAFVVSSSFKSSKNVGQFFGSVDWEMMSELEQGRNSLYTRYTLRNEQGECVEYPAKASSSSFTNPFYSGLTSSLVSLARTVLTFLIHLDIYDFMLADATTPVIQEVSSQKNRSCVTNMTSYYGNVSLWSSFSGNTSCFDCGNSKDMRQYFVAPVPGTNLVLVVVEYFEEKSQFQLKRTDSIPGQQTEIELQDKECNSSSKLPRSRPERCVVSQSEEEEYSCGGTMTFKPNIIFIIISQVLYQIVRLKS